MSKAEKRLERWSENPPQFAPKEEVLAFIERYFSGYYSEESGGSHIRVRHPLLVGQTGYGPNGDFQICSVRGQKVKAVYLELLANAVYLIRNLEK